MVIEVDDALRLRPWDVADAAVVIEAFNTPDIQRWHSRSCTTLHEANAWIVDVKRAWVEDRCATWAIVNPVTNEILGRVAIQVKPAAGSGEISYWVLPTARRSGVATRAVVAATRWAHDVGLHRIEIQHSTANEPSGNVALAAGFTIDPSPMRASGHRWPLPSAATSSS